VLFRFSQPLGRRGDLPGRWRNVMSPRKLLTGKAQNLSSTSGISTRALAIVSLEQKIKRHIILSHCLVGIINSVLVLSPEFLVACRSLGTSPAGWIPVDFRIVSIFRGSSFPDSNILGFLVSRF